MAKIGGNYFLPDAAVLEVGKPRQLGSIATRPTIVPYQDKDAQASRGAARRNAIAIMCNSCAKINPTTSYSK